MSPLLRLPPTCFRAIPLTTSVMKEWRGCVRAFSHLKKCKTDKLNKTEIFPPKELPVVLEDRKQGLLPVVWIKEENKEKDDSVSKMSPEGNDKKKKNDNFFRKTFLIVNVVGISCVLYGYYQKEKLRNSQQEFKHKLNPDAEEIYQQLISYTSFGMGTLLNASLDDYDKVDNKSKKITVWDKYKRLVDTIDCFDAGFLKSDMEEVRRCKKLTSMLAAEIEKHEKSQARKKTKTTTRFIRK